MVKSCVRTITLLEYFSEIQRPVTINEITTKLNIPQSSASNLVSSLVNMGVLFRLENRREFVLTLRVSFLTNWTQDYFALQNRISAHIKSFRNNIKETVILAMRNGIYSQYLAVETGNNELVQDVAPGHSWPLIHTATGWSLLSSEDDIETGKIIRKSLADDKISQVQKKCDVKPIKAIKQTLERGYALSTGEVTQGLAGIAVPLPRFGAHPPLAIAIAGSRSHIARNEIAFSGALQELAQDMAHRFQTY